MLALFGILITVSELAGWPLPAWDEVYTAVMKNQPQHVSGTAPDTATKIHFIDVGQADATLIEQDGEFCLIDAGGTGSAQELTDYLRAAGVKKLKLLVMTHEHADHIGSMLDVLENFEVEQVLLPDFTNADAPDGYNILRTLEYIDVAGIPDAAARVGDSYAIGNGTLTVLGSGIPTDEKNNTSIVSLFTVGGFRFLNCGDAEEDATSVLRKNGTDTRADVYKAAHHGASDSNTVDWLKAVRPRIVTVSCGKDNQFGHPHKSALDAFSSVGAQVYRTDEEGSFIVGVDEAGKIFVTTQNNAAAGEDLQQAA